MSETTTFTNFYDVLEIQTTATDEEIRVAVDQQRRRWIGKQNAPKPELRQQAETRVRQIDRAEQVLLDATERRKFDRELAAYVPPPPSGAAAQGLDWLAKAKEHLHSGDIPMGVYAAREATHAQPQNPEAWATRASASTLDGRSADAVIEYRQALQIAPLRSDLYYGLGAALEGDERYSDAVNAYTRAAELDPEDPQFRASAGSAMTLAGNPHGGLPLIEQAVSEDPANPAYKFMLFFCLRDAGLAELSRLPNDMRIALSKSEAEGALLYWRRARAIHLAGDNQGLQRDLESRIATVENSLKTHWAYSAKTLFRMAFGVLLLWGVAGLVHPALGFVALALAIWGFITITRKPMYELSSRDAKQVYGYVSR